MKPAHTRVTFSGVVGTAAAPIERWSFSVNFPAAALANNADDVTADGQAAALRLKWGEVKGSYGSDVILTETRVAAIDATGHTYVRADGSYVQGIDNTNVAGDLAPQIMPLQTALCVSLHSTRSGPTGKGRFFLPWPALYIAEADKRIPVAQLQTFGDKVGFFINGLHTVLAQPAQVVSSKGYMSQVTSLRIGRVPDTLRSRREDMPEGYLDFPLA